VRRTGPVCLGGQPLDEPEECRAGIAGIAERGAFVGKPPQPVMHDRLEQGLLGGK
jgi:hypothetical protein